MIGTELVEITTFRTEGGYQDSRHPDWVRFVSDIESDLSRRDFTVNAMAYSPYRGFADPFGGRNDLSNGILRAVGDPHVRFTEDALRILRGIRFSVRYRLQVAQETELAMTALAPQLDLLAKERILDELCKLLPLISADELLRFAPIIARIIPELQATLDFDQHSIHQPVALDAHKGFLPGGTKAQGQGKHYLIHGNIIQHIDGGAEQQHIHGSHGQHLTDTGRTHQRTVKEAPTTMAPYCSPDFSQSLSLIT